MAIILGVDSIILSHFCAALMKRTKQNIKPASYPSSLICPQRVYDALRSRNLQLCAARIDTRHFRVPFSTPTYLNPFVIVFPRTLQLGENGFLIKAEQLCKENVSSRLAKIQGSYETWKKEMREIFINLEGYGATSNENSENTEARYYSRSHRTPV